MRTAPLPEHVARNRVYWDEVNAPIYAAPGRRAWASEEISWGIFGVPESELQALPEEVRQGPPTFESEFALLGALHPLDARVPRPIATSADEDVIDPLRRELEQVPVEVPVEVPIEARMVGPVNGPVDVLLPGPLERAG